MAAGGGEGCLQAAVVEVVAAKVRLQQREEEAEEGTVANGSGRSLLVVTKEDGNERSLLVVLCSERLLLVMNKSLLAAFRIDGSERSLLVAFVRLEIIAGCDQGRW
ncbi:hypothetical protein BHE74_00028795 [Ensete ventricosum]|nr:hypothetical protein BHE74_00028795 [Ensete ventricosum]